MAKKPEMEEVEGSGEETTVAIALYAGDVRKLIQLKELEDERSAASIFRKRFGDLLRSALIEASDRKAKELRKEQAKTQP